MTEQEKLVPLDQVIQYLDISVTLNADYSPISEAYKLEKKMHISMLKYLSRLQEAQARIEELEKDKARLDWLIKRLLLGVVLGEVTKVDNDILVIFKSYINDGSELIKASAPTPREAIDNAMSKESEDE